MSQPKPVTHTVEELLRALEDVRGDFGRVIQAMMDDRPWEVVKRQAEFGIERCNEALKWQVCETCAQTFSMPFEGAKVCAWCAGNALDHATEPEENSGPYAPATIWDTVAGANKARPACPHPCVQCAPRGHHWTLHFVTDELLDSIEETTEHEPEDAMIIVCKHCEMKALVSVDAEDLPEN